MLAFAMCLELDCAMCLELGACLCHVLGAPQKLPAVAVWSLGLRALHSIAGTWDGLCSLVIAKRKAVGDRRCDFVEMAVDLGYEDSSRGY